jgi:hypothetical protein
MGLFNFFQPKKIGLNNSINNIKTKLSELTDPAKGNLYDYNYWFEIVINRAETDINTKKSFENKDIVRLSDGHYEEYHYRMIDNNDEEKIDFILPRILCFGEIYNKLLEIEKKNIEDRDISKLDLYMFHSVSSLYGAIKFSINDIQNGQNIVERIYPNYDANLTISNKEEFDLELKQKSIDLLPSELRLILNKLINNKIEESIASKQTSEFVNLIKIIDNVLPIENQSDSILHNDETLTRIYKLSKLLNSQQKSTLERFFYSTIIYSKTFLFVDLLIYLIELSNFIQLDIMDSIENELKDIDTLINIKSTLKDFNEKTFIYIESIKNRFITGEIINELNLKKVIENEFSLDIYISESIISNENKNQLKEKFDTKFDMFMAAASIKIQVDFLAETLNEFENNRFYGFDYIENYHTIYGLLYSSLIENYK